ncbi:MAG: hypothetical protein MUC78_08670 [Bacteroidales bacterium]|nr:hypothetical protein [Bacteroidales bacterium]
MKRKLSLLLPLLFVISCNGPETTVTNFVYRDGTVLRRVEMQNTEYKFGQNVMRVPVDSTWTTNDSISISPDGDTTWYVTAEKIFDSAEAINESYLSDSGSNRGIPRSVAFKREFKWFTTTFYFSEKCSKTMIYGYPKEDYLSNEEIEFMMLPKKIMVAKLTGPDSTAYHAMKDSLDHKRDLWTTKSFISDWIEEAGRLCEASGKDSLTTEILRLHENAFNEIIEPDRNMSNNCIPILGEKICSRFSPELDTAQNVVMERLNPSIFFEDYTLQIVMPAKVIKTNGYLISGGELAWPVTGDHFLTSDYIMFAEARIINYWAIILTLIFLSGLILLIVQFRNRP